MRIDRQSAKQSDQYKDHRGQGGQGASRFECNRWLVPQGAEIIDAGQAHDPQPNGLMAMCAGGDRAWNMGVERLDAGALRTMDRAVSQIGWGFDFKKEENARSAEIIAQTLGFLSQNLAP